jgi:hypothetical protein
MIKWFEEEEELEKQHSLMSFILILASVTSTIIGI